MQLKALGIDNILGFDWLASPPPEAMVRALEVLYSLSIVDDDVKLTSPIGYQIAEVPMVFSYPINMNDSANVYILSLIFIPQITGSYGIQNGIISM